MKPLLLLPLLACTLFAQSKPELSLAPFREAAHKAFAAEMAGANERLCPNLIALPKVAACLDRAQAESKTELASYRAALRASIAARISLLGAQALPHYQTAEQDWDVYSASQLKGAADMADTPVLGAQAEIQARIDLERTHMQTLDRIYYTLLHDDCGACLVNK
jgi:hypothetical protein